MDANGRASTTAPADDAACGPRAAHEESDMATQAGHRKTARLAANTQRRAYSALGASDTAAAPPSPLNHIHTPS